MVAATPEGSLPDHYLATAYKPCNTVYRNHARAGYGGSAIGASLVQLSRTRWRQHMHTRSRTVAVDPCQKLLGGSLLFAHFGAVQGSQPTIDFGDGTCMLIWAIGWYSDGQRELLGTWQCRKQMGSPLAEVLADLRARGVERIQRVGTLGLDWPTEHELTSAPRVGQWGDINVSPPVTCRASRAHASRWSDATRASALVSTKLRRAMDRQALPDGGVIAARMSRWLNEAGDGVVPASRRPVVGRLERWLLPGLSGPGVTAS